VTPGGLFRGLNLSNRHDSAIETRRAADTETSARAILLTVSEINALTERGVWSRLGFSALVAAVGCEVISWQALGLWLGGVCIWELGCRRSLEHWAERMRGDDKSERSLRKLALVHALGATLYALLPALGFLSLTALGAQLALGWIGGAAIHSFVYFSNRRTLLAANLSVPIAVALAVPTIAAGGFDRQALLTTIVTLTLLASSALFAIDRNALLARLSAQISAQRAGEQATALKSQFLATLTHELRIPLNAVIGYSEMLQEDLGEMGAEPLRADAAQIGVAAQHLLVLINNILDLSRQRIEAEDFDPVDTGMPALIDVIEAKMRRLSAT